MDIGTIITTFCEEHGMSSTEFAKRVGVSRAYIYMLKRGKRYKAEKDVIPSVDTIEKLAKAMLMSSGELMALITDKEENNYKKAENIVVVPLVERVADGLPLYAKKNIIGYVEVSRPIAEQNEVFGLIIKGNAMYPEIKNNDIVIIRKQSVVESKDIAIVQIKGDDATCRRVEIANNGMSLIPINPEYESHFYSMEEVEALPVTIVGKVFEVRRKY